MVPLRRWSIPRKGRSTKNMSTFIRIYIFRYLLGFWLDSKRINWSVSGSVNVFCSATALPNRERCTRVSALLQRRKRYAPACRSMLGSVPVMMNNDMMNVMVNDMMDGRNIESHINISFYDFLNTIPTTNVYKKTKNVNPTNIKYTKISLYKYTQIKNWTMRFI